MIDIKIQEVFEYFIKEALWRDTIIPGVQWYYAESELYVFRFPAGYHYGFCFIHAKSPEDVGKYFVDKFWAEHNKVFASGDAVRALRDENKALKAEVERLSMVLKNILEYDKKEAQGNVDIVECYQDVLGIVRSAFMEK